MFRIDITIQPERLSYNSFDTVPPNSPLNPPVYTDAQPIHILIVFYEDQAEPLTVQTLAL